MRTIVVVGGGFSGTLFAIKMSVARPDDRVILVERDRHFGRGVAYGACSPEHLLNVPVSRMEVGLQPSFADWLRAEHGEHAASAALPDAFVPRALFGDYMEAQVRRAGAPRADGSLTLVRGEAVAMLTGPEFGVRLWDGRALEADMVVLAIGNLPPRSLDAFGPVCDDGALFAPDPWSHDALDGIPAEGGVLLVGTGLTTVDIALRLAAAGHRGPMLAVSRHGLLPQRHRSGGAWHPFIRSSAARSPAEVMAVMRREVARADAVGVPWQRVMDAARPAVANIWHNWSMSERRRFLHRARTYWDVHRHRMAPGIADRLDALRLSGQLTIAAGRFVKAEHRDGQASVVIAGRDGTRTQFQAARIVNCTGPRTDFADLGTPLIADLRRRGFLRADPLGVGLDTIACALVDQEGRASNRLFALGPLTRASLWEVTAVPEIAAQVEQFVERLRTEPMDQTRSLADIFHDIGAGI